ncbi:Trk system potassium transporter TrkA [Hutsoniella sourekii]|uniref:Trk system potassium transporter TrkA n=1 Tax=Hutsoniella sourekii TaxID=87650 RepID=UPI0004853C93|nr:Trk system potassium transporter TrkA [Hutsoniella sourekii]
MKIVICGAGQVGEAIVDSLWESTDITLIDPNEEILNSNYSKYDIQGIIGSAVSINVLREAEVESADVFIAVTNSDESNIIASLLAQNLGVDHVYARVRDPKYYEDIQFLKESLGVAEIINPEQDAATLIRQILRFPSANSIDKLLKRRAQLVEITVDKNSPLANRSLVDLTDIFDGRVLVCAIERDSEVIIPQGTDHIQVDDNVFVTGMPDDLKNFYKKIRANSRPCRRILIIGGGNISHYLLAQLNQPRMTVKLIERDHQRAIKIAEAYPNVEVIHGDETDQDLLIEEGLETYDAVVSLSLADEENILISLFAHSQKVRKVIAKVDRPYLLKPIAHMGLESLITPKHLVSERIIRKVRSLIATKDSAVENLHKIVGGAAEALEFKVLRESPITNRPLKDLQLKDHTLMAGILRQDQLIFPGGEDQILVGDTVVIVTKQKAVHDINQLIA